MTVSPRPASTVILMDECSRVYLTKRPNTMKFFGGYHVFPGGAVEKTDNEVDSQYLKIKDSMDSLDFAYYIAAARELFEEAGIFIGTDDDGNTPILDSEKSSEYRRQLLNGEMTFLQLLKKEGLYLNLEHLTYIGQLTTPEGRPIRFETRFFLVNLPFGQIPSPDNNEIEEASWFTPEEALSAFKRGGLTIAPPTILALKTIIDHQQHGSPLLIPKVDPLIWFKQTFGYNQSS